MSPRRGGSPSLLTHENSSTTAIWALERAMGCESLVTMLETPPRPRTCVVSQWDIPTPDGRGGLRRRGAASRARRVPRPPPPPPPPLLLQITTEFTHSERSASLKRPGPSGPPLVRRHPIIIHHIVDIPDEDMEALCDGGQTLYLPGGAWAWVYIYSDLLRKYRPFSSAIGRLNKQTISTPSIQPELSP